MGSPHFYLFSPIESVISISISRILNCILSKHFDDPVLYIMIFFLLFLFSLIICTLVFWTLQAEHSLFVEKILWHDSCISNRFLMMWPNLFRCSSWQDKIWDVFLAWDQGAKTHQPRLLYWAQRIKSFQSLFRFSLHWNSLCSIQYGWCFLRQRLQWLTPMVIQPFKCLRSGVVNVSRSLV